MRTRFRYLALSYLILAVQACDTPGAVTLPGGGPAPTPGMAPTDASPSSSAADPFCRARTPSAEELAIACAGDNDMVIPAVSAGQVRSLLVGRWFFCPSRNNPYAGETLGMDFDELSG